MTFDDDVRAHLLGGVAVAALVGERIFPLMRPNQTLPAITFFTVFDETQNSLDGFTSGLSNVRVQVDVWAHSSREAKAVGLAVRDRMYVAAATFKTARSDGQDLFEDDTRLYRRSLDFSVWYSETS